MIVLPLLSKVHDQKTRMGKWTKELLIVDITLPDPAQRVLHLCRNSDSETDSFLHQSFLQILQGYSLGLGYFG